MSDVHGHHELLRRAVEAMGPIGLLIHAGDGYSDLIRWRSAHPLMRVEMVAGNCDLLAACPEEITFHLDRWKVLLTHGHLYGVKTGLHGLRIRARHVRADLAIYGHTHRPAKDIFNGLTLFNPGSLSPGRAGGRPSYGLIETGPEGLQLSVHELL